MTIYRQEASRDAKRNLRSAKFPSLSRKRNSLKRLPPIYEIDEDCEETVLDATQKHNLQAGRLGNLSRDCDDKCLLVNATVPDKEHWELNKLRIQQQKHREFPAENRDDTSSYLKRNLGRNLSVTSHAEGNNQTIFPDFFPPGMHVHCAQNALPEASKGLYMKIMQGDAELKQNVSNNNKATGSNSSYKQQNWMQFFG